ncbi:MAG: flagellar motor protein MotB [Candidatus Glassbacteria bacterium]|nr:flagellar motor protein MotB [Candidatus Glassbacteria bacterium]
MPKKKCHCEEGAPAWMTTFSDLMSLLLCFFVLLVSMSSVDPSEFNKATGALKGSLGILTEDPSTMELVNEIVPKISDVDLGEISMAISKLQDFVETQKQEESIKVVITSEGIAVRILAPLLFDQGMAELRPQGLPFLAKIFDLAKDWENKIRIAGYTDDTPIKNALYDSNWDLSFARAKNVLNFAVNYSKLPPSRFSAVGYGEYRPAFPNDSEENRKKNRRIEVFIEYDVQTDPLT